MSVSDTERYLDSFANNRFTDYDLVALLLPLLYQNGISQIDENALEEKLFYYYKDDKFRELFQDVAVEDLPSHKAVCLYDGFYREKYFGNGVWFDQMHSDILNLAYGPNMDLLLYEKKLSSDGKTLIRQLAHELAVRYKAEKNSQVKLNILGTAPNCYYQLVQGKNRGMLLGFELITDGDIQTISYPDTRAFGKYYYESPIAPSEAIQLEDSRIAHVKLQNASYAIKQGICERKICYSNVNTQILKAEELAKIVAIANRKYDGDEYALTLDAPYVRKLVIK